MKKFELFCMIFYLLDSIYDKNPNVDLGNYLSCANPFLFKDLTSADPDIYIKFEKFCSKPISNEDYGYNIASEYIKSLNIETAQTGFNEICLNDWILACKEYLSTNHKI